MGGCLGLINHPGLALQTNARDVPGLERWALSPRVSAISGSISHPRGCVSVGGQDCYFSFALVCSYTTQWSKGRGLKKLKLHPGWPKRFHVSRSKSRHSGTWGAAGLPPPRRGARRAPALRRPARGTTVHTGPGAPMRGSAAGVTGEEEAGVTGEAAHGPRRSSGGAARGSVPAVGRRAAASASLLWPAGTPPCPRPRPRPPRSWLFSLSFPPALPLLSRGSKMAAPRRITWATGGSGEPGGARRGRGPRRRRGYHRPRPSSEQCFLALGRFYGIHALSVLVEIQNSINMHYGLNLLGHSSSPHLPHLSLHPFACESGWTTLLKRFIGGWRDSCKGPGFGS